MLNNSDICIYKQGCHPIKRLKLHKTSSKIPISTVLNVSSYANFFNNTFRHCSRCCNKLHLVIIQQTEHDLDYRISQIHRTHLYNFRVHTLQNIKTFDFQDYNCKKMIFSLAYKKNMNYKNHRAVGRAIESSMDK